MKINYKENSHLLQVAVTYGTLQNQILVGNSGKTVSQINEV